MRHGFRCSERTSLWRSGWKSIVVKRAIGQAWCEMLSFVWPKTVRSCIFLWKRWKRLWKNIHFSKVSEMFAFFVFRSLMHSFGESQIGVCRKLLRRISSALEAWGGHYPWARDPVQQHWLKQFRSHSAWCGHTSFSCGKEMGKPREKEQKSREEGEGDSSSSNSDESPIYSH